MSPRSQRHGPADSKCAYAKLNTTFLKLAFLVRLLKMTVFPPLQYRKLSMLTAGRLCNCLWELAVARPSHLSSAMQQVCSPVSPIFCLFLLKQEKIHLPILAPDYKFDLCENVVSKSKP
jgi:hypothetical protein